MAGLGYKSFASGEVLTAANLQGYAVDQSVMKFATTAARTTALAAPSQGMMSWIDATGNLEIYYELYNASTNPGGAKTAGWYPATSQAMFFGSCTRTLATTTTYALGSSGFAFTEVIDNHSWHDATTNPDRITPTFQGLYRFSVHAAYGASTVNVRITDINKTGSVYQRVMGNGTNYGPQLVNSNLVYMNGSTDYLTCTVYQDSGGNLSMTAYFSLEFIRPSNY